MNELLGKLIGMHEKELLRYAWIIVKDRMLAEDAVQNAFIALTHSKQTIIGNHRAWLYCVVRNKCLNIIRKRKNHGELQLAEYHEFAEHDASPSDIMMEAERQLIFLRCLSLLKAQHREVLMLKIDQNKSYREISEITGLSVGNVGFILHTATTTLRKLVKKELGES
ncbi:MAG: sigma-70 family RNA polymerase sigma factor [Victivallaceae bacterium]|nr:sigma-70 family RNA polymerase sigma factor [Victivallaceae bacterium]